MEILMKVKCTPSPNTTSTPQQTSLKVVDHHQQLQQQHHSIKSSRTNGLHYVKPNISITPVSESTLSTCVDYTTPPAMSCCSGAVHPKTLIDMHWKRGAVNSIPPPTASNMDCSLFCEYGPCCSGVDLPACCGGYVGTMPAQHLGGTAMENPIPPNGNLHNNESHPSFEYEEPEENFVSIEDDKIKAFLLKIGEEEKERQKQKQSQRQRQKRKSSPRKLQEPIIFEIIELDDEEEREKLQRLKKSAEEREVENNKFAINTTNLPKLTPKHVLREEKRNSPSISLIPKSPEKHVSPVEVIVKPKEKIIARIDLLDSDSDESFVDDVDSEKKQTTADNAIDGDAEMNEDEESGTLAANAVSCELGCDDDGNENSADEPPSGTKFDYSSSNDKVYVLNSDDEDNVEFMEEREEESELQWDDLEEHSNSRERQLFECHICGKSVQSNYNLRRHMMIHTGERPFGCDMCDRRFREISDLKKHRRRHAAEKNFVCMICRVNAPLPNDSTKCGSCDTKNGTLIAAVRPDTIKSSSGVEQILSATPFDDSSTTNSFAVSAANDSETTTEKITQVKPAKATSPVSLPPLTPIVPKMNSELKNSKPEKRPPAFAHCSFMRTVRGSSRKSFACPMCKRSFGTRHNLKRHFMIHTGEKPFSCPHCRKPFREYSTLKKHLVTHRRDRWYKCLRCPQKYRDFLDYTDHKNTHHGSDVSSDDGGGGGSGSGEGVKPRKRAKVNYDDQDDIYQSNDEDDFDGEEDDLSTQEDCLECCECGQRFTEIEKFTEHVKEHDSSRIVYECYICNKYFEEQHELMDHMNMKHRTEMKV